MQRHIYILKNHIKSLEKGAKITHISLIISIL